jgi:hypothetical protein
MGLDPIQHQLTLSIVCAVQATGCYLVSRAWAKVRSDWQQHQSGSRDLASDLTNNLASNLVMAQFDDPAQFENATDLTDVLRAIEPQVGHQVDLQAWDQQFAMELAQPREQIMVSVEDEPIDSIQVSDPWMDPLPIEDLTTNHFDDDAIEKTPLVVDSNKPLADEDQFTIDQSTVYQQHQSPRLPVETSEASLLATGSIETNAFISHVTASKIGTNQLELIKNPDLEQPIDLKDLQQLTVPQLRSKAKQLGLKNYSRQSKAQLLMAIHRQLERST